MIGAGGGCSTKVLDFDADAGTGGTAGSAAGSGANTAADAPPQICGQHMCSEGQVCCYATSTCIDANADPQSCGNADAGTAPTFPDDISQICWSDLDCAPFPGNVCTGGCAGSGVCEPREAHACGYREPAVAVCGCDGKDYPSQDAACIAGIRVAGSHRCGQGPRNNDDPTKIVCAIDSNCPAGLRCCGFSGRCFDETKPEDCAPPSGAPGAPCNDDDECQTHFCYQADCDGPKVCAREQRPGCGSGGGEVQVCTCNGKTYRNRNCALFHRHVVAHDGACE